MPIATRRIGVFSSSLGLLCFLLACGDDGGAGGAAASSSTATATGSGSSGASKSTSGTASASTSAPATSQSSSTGSDEPEPCTLAAAEDRTGVPSVTITTVGITYTPKCVRVSAGTEVVFESSFSAHPLVGGPIENGIGVADPASPITRTDTGTSATFTLVAAGEVPYFCENHSSIGMFGTIYVE